MLTLRPFRDRPIAVKIGLAVAALVFLMLAVSLVTFLVWYFGRKAEANRKKAIQEAMDQTANEAWQQPQRAATAA